MECVQRTTDYPPELVVSRVNFHKVPLQPDNQSYQFLFVFAVPSNRTVNEILCATVLQSSVKYHISGLKL